MPCACTRMHLQTLQASPLICALRSKKNASRPPRLCTRRTFVLAIICIMFTSWPFLVYAEAQAGFKRSLPYHGGERYSSELSSEALLLLNVTKQKSSGAERISKFHNRKFLRYGTEIANDSRQELYPEAPSDFLPDGIMQLSSGNNKFPGKDSNPYRRVLIPATNVCSSKDISISQGPDGSSGIPRYFVQIMNTCMSDCAPSQVHVSCGWFASALLVNPNTFQRLAYNDCLVNGGEPLKYGEIVSFSYANSFMYPIRFKSASFCR